MLSRRERLQRRLNVLLILFIAGIVSGLLAIAFFQSVPMAIGVIVYMVAVSRYGYRTFTCPCCNRSIYKKVVKEANIFVSRVPEACPYCHCRYDTPLP